MEPRRRSPRETAYRGNLPSELTTFVGRIRDIREIKGLFDTGRLVTLIGAGGCGKTRLALRVARESQPVYPDGIWFVELAAVGHPDRVPRSVIDALGIQEEPGQSILQTLTAHIVGRRTLLVLDNCEHLAVACAKLIDWLLRHAPELRVLATSREPLRVDGENAWRVRSLGLAGPEAEGSLPNLRKIESIQLFADRATARQSGFSLTSENALAVVDICRRLDGIPLAIELAAALVPTLSVDVIAQRLDHALQLLVVGNRVVPRQETLRATIDWSYDLLGDPERQVMRRLAVFAGSFSVEAVEDVIPDDESTAASVLASLSRLVDASLVVASSGASGSRYRLLEPVRQYAMEKLNGSGERDAVYRRHASFFLALADKFEPVARIGRRGTWRQTIEDDLDNFRAALEWGVQSDSTEAWETRARLAAGLRWFWVRAARVGEGREWLERATATSDRLSRRTRAKVTSSAGLIAWLSGDEAAARRWLEEGADLHDDLGDIAERAFDLAIRCMVDEPGDVTGESETRLDESERLFTRIGDDWGLAIVQQVRALRTLRRGDSISSREHLERALVLFREVGDGFFVAQVLNSLGDVARELGEAGRAAARYRESLEEFQLVGQRAGIPSILHNLAHVSLHQGDFRRAAELFRDSLNLFHQQGDRRGVAECLAGLAGTVSDQQPRRAAWLIGAADGLLDAIGATMWPSNQKAYQNTVLTARTRIDASTLEAELLAGRTAAWSDVTACVNEIVTEPRRAHRQSSPSPSANEPDSLTPRERDVAALVARGMTNRQIADTLVISSGTATLHVKRILSKLGVTSRAAIAAWAIARGLGDRRPS